MRLHEIATAIFIVAGGMCAPKDCAASAQQTRAAAAHAVPSLDIELTLGESGDDQLERGIYIFHLKCAGTCELSRITLNQCSLAKSVRESSFLPRTDQWSSPQWIDAKQTASNRIDLTVYQAFEHGLPATMTWIFNASGKPFSTLQEIHSAGFIDYREFPSQIVPIKYSPLAADRLKAYDTANRLLSSTVSGSTQNVYGYDHASNLLSISAGGTTQSFSYTSTNAITAATYDANGSPSVFSGNTYKWDGANRIVRFTSSAANTASSFSYDGLGRLVRVVDTHAGAITADHSYTWCGNMRCLAHDNTQSGSPVSTQYFDQGAIIAGTSYYYVKDQLGSVAEMITGTGTIAAQYNYDPYGNRTVVSGTLVSDVGYAGYFYHVVSGLDFTMYRAYDPTHARWLNRDPIGEMGDTNPYDYVGGSPASFNDPLGLIRWSAVGSSVASLVGSGAGIAVGSALFAAPTGVSQVIGGVVLVKSGYSFGIAWYNLTRALSDDDSFDVSSRYSTLPRAIASVVSCSQNAQSMADVADLAIDFAAGRATAGFVRNQSGFLRNATGYPPLNSNQFTHAALFSEIATEDLNRLVDTMQFVQSLQYLQHGWFPD